MNSMIQEFNTSLSPQQETQFWDWVAKQSPQAGRDMGLDLHDYDLRGYWLESQGSEAQGHFTDRYKKPNHPSFSVESQYHSNEYRGGVWGRDSFTPSPQMLTDPRRVQFLKDYFQFTEPDVELILPD